MNSLKVELHCHSEYSKDSLNKLEDLIRVARKRGIQKLAITDHNNIEGALKARELDPELIIVGEEILTTKGELLVFFLTKSIPRGLDPMAAIDQLKIREPLLVSHILTTVYDMAGN